MLDGPADLFLAADAASVDLLNNTHSESRLQELDHGNVVVKCHFLPIVHEVVLVRLYVALED